MAHGAALVQGVSLTVRPCRMLDSVWASNSTGATDGPSDCAEGPSAALPVSPTSTILSLNAVVRALSLSTATNDVVVKGDVPSVDSYVRVRITAELSVATSRPPRRNAGGDAWMRRSSAPRCRLCRAASRARDGMPAPSYRSRSGTWRTAPSLSAMVCRCPTPKATEPSAAIGCCADWTDVA